MCNKRKHKFLLNLKNCFIALGILIIAFIICFILSRFFHHANYCSLVFILAVILVSRFTGGYIYGSIMSIIAVFGIYIFKVNSEVFDYALNFIIMLIGSIVVSSLKIQVKKYAVIKDEIEKEKTKANLLRAISHDIRTPLSSILGSSTAYLDNCGKLSDEAKYTLVSDIKDEAVWLIRTVENLLSITRINDSFAKVDKNPEIIEEVLGDAASKFKRQFPNIELNIKVPDDILFVPMDALLIEQVLLNLLENAVIHGEKTTVIDIQADVNESFATITVSDNGNGLKDEMLSHLCGGNVISEDKELAGIKRNMGIGLSVCMTIIKAHGGNLRAYNKKDGGAVFEFTLPL
ncbi:MAG: ATP-binding protein [Bacillota bacterium]|nr:ATP-binding protein [Bacillota bacterium]